MNPKMLKHFPLFAALPDEELTNLVDFVHSGSLPSNTLLCKEGDIGDRMYLIVDGEVEVILALGTEEERKLSILGEGEFVGEMSLLEKEGVRTATVRTLSDIEFLEITRKDFDDLLSRWPNLAIDMLRELSLRLRSMEKATIKDLQEKNQALAQAYQELKAAQTQIIEKERLEKELQVAHQIQISMLPTSLPQIPNYEFAAKILPARAVGGDLFDFVPLANGMIGILIGDVSDKGVPAALFMALTRSLLRTQAELQLSPVQVIRNVNHYLMDMNSSNMFVTLIYGLLCPDSGKFTYARAGHETPILVDREGKVETIPHSPGQLIGIFSDPKIDEQIITILPADTLLLYTDGVPDAQEPDGDYFGHVRLKNELFHLRGQAAQDICDHIFQSVIDFQQTELQNDDITLLVIKRTG